MEEVTLTNMTMLIDENSNVLVLNRTKNWKGYVFPGGKMEKGESFVKSAVREMYEETGLEILDPHLVGLKQFSEDRRYIVFLFKATKYKGSLKPSSEGEVFWLPLEELKKSPHLMPPYFEPMLKVFLEDDCNEMYLKEGRDGKWETEFY